MVDDVSLVERPSYNLVFADIMPWLAPWFLTDGTRTQASGNYSTPVSQVDSRLFGFGARFYNAGLLDETGARLVIQVDYEDEQGNVISSDFRDSTWFDLRAGRDTIVMLPGTYEPTVPGEYTVYYTLVSSGNDLFLQNNVDTQTFIISNTNDNWLSKVSRAADGGPAAMRSILSGAPSGATLTEFEYGSMFYIKTADAPMGRWNLDSMYYRPVNYDTSQGASMAGEVITLTIYEWRDTDGDGGLPSDHATGVGTELFIVGIAQDTLPQGVQSGDLRRIKLLDALNPAAGGSVPLQDSIVYLTTVQTRKSDGVFIGVRAYDELNYTLNIFANEADGLPLWPAPTRVLWVEMVILRIPAFPLGSGLI